MALNGSELGVFQEVGRRIFVPLLGREARERVFFSYVTSGLHDHVAQKPLSRRSSLPLRNLRCGQEVATLRQTMRLRSLLLCQEISTVQIIARVCKELGVELEHCPRADGAVARLSIGRFDAIFVDDGDPRAAVSLLDKAKSFPSCKKSLGIVLADSQTSLGVAFGTGTHLVIYKPITLDRVRNGLRAVRTLTGRRHARAPRVRVDIPASLHRDGKTEISASLVDISESGAAVRVKEQLSAPGNMMLRFSLPGTAGAITASVEIVWRDAKGRVGIQFVSMPAESTRGLKRWLSGRGTR